MFRGEYEHTIDEKGRLLIPIKFREELGDTIVVGRGTLGQINLYPKATFEAMERQVDEVGGNTLYFATLLMAASNETELDKQGRIVVPPVLRRHAKLGAEVIITGNRDHIEVWNPDEWLQTYGRLVDEYRKQHDDLARLRELGVRM